MARVDARLREMQFLAQLDLEGPRAYQEPYTGTPEQQMILSLLHDGYLNEGLDELRAIDKANRHILLERHQWVRGQHIGALIAGEKLRLEISHKGRVRLSELEQQLRTGRDRDETGLLLAKRHLTTDLAIALLSASNDAPLSVVFLDMNGLGSINNTHGHAAGDDVIRAFFQATLSTIAQYGEAYRNGGDEVVVILPSTTDEQADKLLNVFVRQLGKDVLRLGESGDKLALTASCGSVSAADPAENAGALLQRADKVMYRAKDASKTQTPRVSAIAVGDGEATIYAPGT